MKTKLSLLILVLQFAICILPCTAQVPQGFNYQAIARDGDGNLITDAFYIKVEIQNLAADTVFWIEEHNVTPNEYGLISFIVGQSGRIGGTETDFEDIDWISRPRYLKTSAKYPGPGYTVMGTTQIMSVPYSLVAKDVTGPVGRLGIKGTTDEMDEALFEVRNKDGQIIFAVYNQGVRIYVDDAAKGPKGGFAIGGFGTAKDKSQPYFIVKPDTIRVYINQSGKGAKGGFAIGGYGTNKTDPQNFLFISDDSVRVYVDNADDDTPKGVKGGFAIGGFGTSKGDQKFLTVSDDSVRIYINDNSKSSKGGFAIGGFGTTKGGTSYLNVETDATGKVDPAQNRILWYPLKNAFLVGNVLISTPDNVGENSFATGYQSMAKGQFSQAMGYRTKATGDNATALGSMSEATGNSAIAVGISTVSSGNGSAAFGAHSTASGGSSISMGYNNQATGPVAFAAGSHCQATNANATALGWGSAASGIASTAIGNACLASGDYSYALGQYSQATGLNSYAFGESSKATGSWTYAIGYKNRATWGPSYAFGDNTVCMNWGATSTGWFTKANANHSMTLGHHTISKSIASLVMGVANDTAVMHTDSWEREYSDDPVFIIGNGQVIWDGSKYVVIERKNSFTILRDGKTGINMNYPSYHLDVNGEVASRNADAFRLRGSSYSTIISHDESDFYLKVTNSGNPDGLSNNFRPFRIEYSSGNVFIGNDNYLTPYTMAVQSDGKVGINCIPSTHNLEVNGTICSFNAGGDALLCLSNYDVMNTSMVIGRTSGEGRIAVAANYNQWLFYTVAGDIILRTESSTQKIHLGVNRNDAPVVTIMEDGGLDYEGGRLGINVYNPDHPLQVGRPGLSNGNGAHVTTGGTWTNSSSRSNKERFNAIDPRDILDKIGKLDIESWYYKNTEEYHIGPVAEDFYNLFGTGDKNSKDVDKYLSSSDVAGVSIVAIQEIIRQNDEQKEKIEQQQVEIDYLKAELEQVKALVEKKGSN